MASIKKRTENSYTITVSCGYTADGKKLSQNKTVKLPETMTAKQREKELNRLAVLFEEEVKNGAYLDGSKVTFAEFTQKWLKEYAEVEGNLAPGTLKPYKDRLKERILPAIGHLKIGKLQPHHLLEFYNNLKETGIRRDGKFIPTPELTAALENYTTTNLVKLSGVSFKTCQRLKKGEPTNINTAEKICTALFGNTKSLKNMFSHENGGKLNDKTVRNHHYIISSILSTAVKWNVIPYNPAERVDLGKATKSMARYYNVEQLSALFAALENEPFRYKTAIYVAIDTGARLSEIAGLKWTDFVDGAVTVDKQRQYVNTVGTFVSDPKTENGKRTLPVTLSPTVSAMLNEYRDLQARNALEQGDAWRNTDGYIFVHEDGEPMHPSRPSKWFSEFLERHGLDKITFHQLRHTNASVLISLGIDIATLGGRLGHGDPNVTLRTYTHIIKSKEQQAANAMEQIYKKHKKH